MLYMLVHTLHNFLGGRVGDHQMIKLNYRGEGGGPVGPKKDYIIF